MVIIFKLGDTQGCKVMLIFSTQHKMIKERITFYGLLAYRETRQICDTAGLMDWLISSINGCFNSVHFLMCVVDMPPQTHDISCGTINN